MKILVTGGAGFIGSNYVRSLLSGKNASPSISEITVLDLLTYAGNPDNLPLGDPRVSLVKGDICDKENLGQVLSGHDCVVHFAAESHVDRSLYGPSDFVQTNVTGSQTLFEMCLESSVRTVVHVSTDEVYGSIDKGSWTEEEALLPNSPYAASKASADLIARSFWRTYGIDIRVTRCANNYGPYQHPEKMLPLFITNLIEGRPVPLYGTGENVREWLHVDDHCQGINRVLQRGEPGEIYNIGGGASLSNIELTKILLDKFGYGWEMVAPVPDRKGHDLRYSIDISKIGRNLQYAPNRELDEGIESVINWYTNNTDWWIPAKYG